MWRLPLVPRLSSLSVTWAVPRGIKFLRTRSWRLFDSSFPPGEVVLLEPRGDFRVPLLTMIAPHAQARHSEMCVNPPGTDRDQTFAGGTSLGKKSTVGSGRVLAVGKAGTYMATSSWRSTRIAENHAPRALREAKVYIHTFMIAIARPLSPETSAELVATATHGLSSSANQE